MKHFNFLKRCPIFDSLHFCLSPVPLPWKFDNQYYHDCYYKGDEEKEDFTLETVEDCFDDVPKPRFGLVVKITKDVTCESEINCPVPVSPENYYFQSRQTGEGFRSSAPPDCRVIVN